SASFPFDGLRRFTSAMTPMPGSFSAAIASRGSGALAARFFSSSSGSAASRSARSARTPTMMSSSTLTGRPPALAAVVRRSQARSPEPSLPALRMLPARVDAPWSGVGHAAATPDAALLRRRTPSTFFGRVFPLRQRRPQVVAVVGGGAGSSAGLLAVPLVMSSAALLLLRALRGGRFVAAPHPGQPVPAGHEQATRRAGQQPAQQCDHRAHAEKLDIG